MLQGHAIHRRFATIPSPVIRYLINLHSRINTERGYAFWCLDIHDTIDVPLLREDFTDIRVFAGLLEALDDIKFIKQAL